MSTKSCCESEGICRALTDMNFRLLVVSAIIASLVQCYSYAFRNPILRNPTALLKMATIAEGVEFNTIAREWRWKFDTKNEKKSLVSSQQTLNVFKSQLQKISGVKSIQRIVCGGCLDFKVIVALSADKYGDWEKTGHAPEAEFINALKAIDGITQLETQTYTIEPV